MLPFPAVLVYFPWDKENSKQELVPLHFILADRRLPKAFTENVCSSFLNELITPINAFILSPYISQMFSSSVTSRSSDVKNVLLLHGNSSSFFTRVSTQYQMRTSNFFQLKNKILHDMSSLPLQHISLQFIYIFLF